MRPRELPTIPKYDTWHGRRLLHARYAAGRPSQARQEGRPWHVVAADPAQLVRDVQPKPASPERLG